MNSLFSKEATVWLRSVQRGKSIGHLGSIEQTRTKHSCPGSKEGSVSPKACGVDTEGSGQQQACTWRCFLGGAGEASDQLSGESGSFCGCRRTLVLCECHVFLRRFKTLSRTKACQGKNKPTLGCSVPCQSFTANVCSEIPPVVCSELSHRGACEWGRSWLGRFFRTE